MSYEINDDICRCLDPAVRHQLVKCCVISLSGWLMQAEKGQDHRNTPRGKERGQGRGHQATSSSTGGNTRAHDLSWFRPRGHTSSKGVCEGTVLSCTGGTCSRGYKRGERGREAPKSLLEEKLIEASANIGAQKSVCVCATE